MPAWVGEVLLPVWDSLVRQMLGLLDLNGRLGLAFLTVSYLVAYVLYRRRRASGRTPASSFWQFLGGAAVHPHPSVWLDCRYYLLRGVLKVGLIVPVVALFDPVVARAGDVEGFLTRLWGARPQAGQDLGLSLLYGLGVFLIRDFCHYWTHRAFHTRWLWAFHKVHHSAPVLVPVTASRVHFMEKIIGSLVDSVCLGLYGGAFWYLCGGEVSAYTLFGVTYLVLIFNALAANLRHSHVWLSFGPLLEHVLNSPAQHQIHHSDNPRHFHCNFGTCLSVWDWWFGTLYVTGKTCEVTGFGAGEGDDRRYASLWALLVTPFADLAGQLLPVRSRRAQ